MVKANFHTHSVFSDGKNTPEEIVQQALSLGMTGLGFSDHIDPETRVTIKDFPGYLQTISALREKYAQKIEILIGAEVDNLMADFDTTGVDYTIGSTHYLDLGLDQPVPMDNRPEYMISACNECFGGDFYQLTKRFYEFVAQVGDRVHPTFIGHFDLIIRNLRAVPSFDTGNPRYRMPALEAMEYLVSKGFPFEVNCGAVSRGISKDNYPDMFFLKCLQEFGGEIIVNTDAHKKELLLGAFDGGIEAAKACGFDHVNVLTKEGTGKLHFKQIGI